MMAWIEVHQELRSHPKVVRTSVRLKKDLATTLGYLVSLWLWASAYARDGDLTAYTSDEISMACNAIDVRDLKKILIETRWLDEKGGKILIHDWKKHGLRVLEQAKRRTAKSRKEKDLGGRTVTQPLRNGDALLSSFLTNHSNVHVLATGAFKESWNEWIVFRREKRKPLLESQAIKQLQWLALQLDPVACIEQSIRNGWQGLFELKSPSNLATVRSKRTRECDYCHEQIPVDEYYARHLTEGVCPKFKPASQEVVSEVLSEVGSLEKQMHVEPGKGERKR